MSSFAGDAEMIEDIKAQLRKQVWEETWDVLAFSFQSEVEEAVREGMRVAYGRVMRSCVATAESPFW